MPETADNRKAAPAPHHNGVAAPATCPPLTAAALLEATDAWAIAQEAEDAQDLFTRVRDNPVLYAEFQRQFAPVLAGLRRSVPSTDVDESGEPYPYGDAFNARLLVSQHRDELCYCVPWKSWLVWTGTLWEKDETGVVWRWLREALMDLWHASERWDDADLAKACRSHVTKSLGTGRMEGACKTAQTFAGMALTPAQFDVSPWLLNCANGTLDLRTGALQPHQAADRLTKSVSTPYRPDAPCATWEAFLWRILGGSQGDDDEAMGSGELENRRLADARATALTAFVQRFVGYSLTGDTREQCLVVLHGTGSNGKSTFLETLRALFGAYALTTPSASLLAKERSGDASNDIARLRGARLVTAVEIGEGKRLNEELLKRLTGQDMLTARFLFSEFFEFRPQFKLIVGCNHLPTIRGTDHAIWRRLHCVPFDVTIAPQEQDKDLGAKLQAELPGILAWAVRGCLAWQDEGLGVPDVVQHATAAYRSDQDSLGRFLAECCVHAGSARVKAGDLYSAYQAWCTRTGEACMTLTAMGRRLEERGFRKTTTNYVWRLGLALRDPVDG